MRSSAKTILIAFVAFVAGAFLMYGYERYMDHQAALEAQARAAEQQKSISERIWSIEEIRARKETEEKAFVEECMRTTIAEKDRHAEQWAERTAGEVLGIREVSNKDTSACHEKYRRMVQDRELRERYAADDEGSGGETQE